MKSWMKETVRLSDCVLGLSENWILKDILCTHTNQIYQGAICLQHWKVVTAGKWQWKTCCKNLSSPLMFSLLLSCILRSVGVKLWFVFVWSQCCLLLGLFETGNFSTTHVGLVGMELGLVLGLGKVTGTSNCLCPFYFFSPELSNENIKAVNSPRGGKYWQRRMPMESLKGQPCWRST